MFLLIDAFRMIRDVGRSSRAVNIWGGLLNIPQLIGGLLFISVFEAQVILITLIITLSVAGQIHKRTPFSRLIGLCHIPWLMLLPWLLYQLHTETFTLIFQVWAYYLAVTIAISLLFDTLDVYRYTQGQKTFSWSE